MECPYFAGMYMKHCEAGVDLYVPSIYAMKEYCINAIHTSCPYYIRADRGDVKMSTMYCRDTEHTQY